MIENNIDLCNEVQATRIMNEMTYKASYSALVKGISIAMVLLSLGLLPLIYFQPRVFAGWINAGILLPSTFICYLYSVKSYTVTADKLIMNRRLRTWNKEIVLNNIESIRLSEEEDFYGAIRTFGVGGLFGYYGSFRSRKLGNFKMNATNSRNRVIIRLKNPNQIMVISPDDGALVDDIRSKIKG